MVFSRHNSNKKGVFMSLFNKGRHSAKGMNLSALLLIISAVIVIVLAIVIIITATGKKEPEYNPETKFIEHETQVIKKNEKITINDPLLGTIEIYGVEGFAKNTYINENFITDENGLMTYYIDDKVASCMGVDLSEYQGEVDFKKLKEQGISFVILRIGGRYYSEEGDMYADSKFFDYYEEAKAAGLDVGAYFFSQAKNEQEGIQEAQYTLDLLQDIPLDYPVAFDWEIIEGDSARTDNVTGEQLTAAALGFCNTINHAGYKSIIYSNTNLMYYQYDLKQLKDTEFWIADYEYHPSMYYYFTMWQYDIEGQLEGIDGNVDLNICMKNY